MDDLDGAVEQATRQATRVATAVGVVALLIGVGACFGHGMTVALLAGVGAMVWTWPRGRNAVAPAPPRPQRVSRTRCRPVGTALCLLLFGGLGTAVLVLVVPMAVEQEVQLWTARPVQATVIAVTLADPQKMSRSSTLKYRPDVRHRYAFNGAVYESNRLYPRAEHYTERHARAATAVFRPGERVYTHVPPGNPGAAFLVPQRNWGPLTAIPLGLAFLGFALAVSVMLLRDWRAGRVEWLRG